MRIIFVDPIAWDYNVETPFHMPLGGSQSALCYLSIALAARGHEVYTLTCTRSPGTYRGVHCLSAWTTPTDLARQLNCDTAVVLNCGTTGSWIREQVSDQLRILAWTQHTTDQPAMTPLSDAQLCNAYDGFIFVSRWQQKQYQDVLGIDIDRTSILRNAIGPAFEQLFAQGKITTHKIPGTLAYTSTPFRGMDRLPGLFQRIHAAHGGAVLKIFSSMAVYRGSPADEREFAQLYDLCRATEGIDYVGSLPQPELARQLTSVSILAYPNSFPETSCIAVMEAMAAGCRIVTSRRAALPETTADFAQLIDVDRGRDAYDREFSAAVIEQLQIQDEAELEETLQRQVSYIHQHCTWQHRARQWEQWLES